MLWKNTESKVGNKGFRFPDQAKALQVNPNSPEILAIWVEGEAEGRPQIPSVPCTLEISRRSAGSRPPLRDQVFRVHLGGGSLVLWHSRWMEHLPSKETRPRRETRAFSGERGAASDRSFQGQRSSQWLLPPTR